MIIHNCEQYSEDWWEIRIGKPTASKFDKIITSTGKPSTQWKDYCYEIAGAMKIGYYPESYQNEHMKRGHELEPEARSVYQMITGYTVEQVGCILPDDESCLCSPDGVMFEQKKGLEIKCPKLGTHMKYLHENRIPPKYIPQVYGSLYICDELDSWDFVSYYPGLALFCTSISRSDQAFKSWSLLFKSKLNDFLMFLKRI